MDKHSLLKMTAAELDAFIRSRLAFTPHELQQIHYTPASGLKFPHKRFDMSGSGDMVGSCFRHNSDILHLFADCGIYNQITFFYLDAYKGTMTLYYQGWDDTETHVEDFPSLGTVEIIKRILHYLVIANPSQCRRTS